MNRLTPVVAIIVGTCLLAGLAYAGGTPVTDKGTKECVFMFSGLSNLGLNPVAGGVACRYYFRNGVAVRPGVEFGYSSSTDKDPTGQNHDQEITGTDIGVSLILERHRPAIYSVSPYAGVGVGFDYASDETKYAGWPKTGGQPKTEQSGFGFRVMGLCGFQWFFTDAMSLGGEYRIAYTYSSSEQKYTDQNGSTSTTADVTSNVFGFQAASVFFSVRVK